MGTIEGFAAVFGRLSENLGGYREKIRPGAFQNSIKSNDIVGLYNHDHGNVLGRTAAGTMRLRETEVGLETVIDLPATQLGRDTYELVRRGDLSGMSFGFHVVQEAWNSTSERELIEIDLMEVSVVAFPAYKQTTIEARSLGLPADVEVLTYEMPTVSEEERERLRLRLDLLRRL